jgi:DNA-binding transcriptional LysR family regulator
MQRESMLDAAKLATLRAVIDAGSFSAAARARSLTQPAVSRQITLLEAQLGTPLLRRSRQGVAPTEAGRLLAQHAAEVERRLALAEAEVAALAGKPPPPIRLGSFFTAFAVLTPEIEARAEQLEFEHELVDPATALAQVAAGELDAAIVFSYGPSLPPAGVELIDLFTDPPRVLLPSKHPLAERDMLHCADLANETWLRARDGGAAELLDATLARAGIAPPLRAAGRGDEPVEAQVYVAAGAGVMVAHELNVIVNRHGIAIRPLTDGIPPTIRLAAPRERTPAIDTLIGYFSAAGHAIR